MPNLAQECAFRCRHPQKSVPNLAQPCVYCIQTSDRPGASRAVPVRPRAQLPGASKGRPETALGVPGRKRKEIHTKPGPGAARGQAEGAQKQWVFWYFCQNGRRQEPPPLGAPGRKRKEIHTKPLPRGQGPGARPGTARDGPGRPWAEKEGNTLKTRECIVSSNYTFFFPLGAPGKKRKEINTKPEPGAALGVPGRRPWEEKGRKYTQNQGQGRPGAQGRLSTKWFWPGSVWHNF